MIIPYSLLSINIINNQIQFFHNSLSMKTCLIFNQIPKYSFLFINLLNENIKKRDLITIIKSTRNNKITSLIKIKKSINKYLKYC